MDLFQSMKLPEGLDAQEERIHWDALEQRIQRMPNAAVRAERNGVHADTLLHCAARHGVPASIIDLLIAKGLNAEEMNQEGRTPLHIAAGNPGTVHVIERLLAQNRTNINLLTEDEHECTALHFAVKYDIEENVRTLVQLGANVEVDDQEHGQTPTHLAVEKNLPGIARILTAATAGGVSAWIMRDNEGATPQDAAAERSGSSSFFRSQDAQYSVPIAAKRGHSRKALVATKRPPSFGSSAASALAFRGGGSTTTNSGSSSSVESPSASNSKAGLIAMGIGFIIAVGGSVAMWWYTSKQTNNNFKQQTTTAEKEAGAGFNERARRAHRERRANNNNKRQSSASEKPLFLYVMNVAHTETLWEGRRLFNAAKKRWPKSSLAENVIPQDLDSDDFHDAKKAKNVIVLLPEKFVPLSPCFIVELHYAQKNRATIIPVVVPSTSTDSTSKADQDNEDSPPDLIETLVKDVGSGEFKSYYDKEGWSTLKHTHRMTTSDVKDALNALVDLTFYEFSVNENQANQQSLIADILDQVEEE